MSTTVGEVTSFKELYFKGHRIVYDPHVDPRRPILWNSDAYEMRIISWMTLNELQPKHLGVISDDYWLDPLAVAEGL